MLGLSDMNLDICPREQDAASEMFWERLCVTAFWSMCEISQIE